MDIPQDKIFAYQLYQSVIAEPNCNGQVAAREEIEKAVFRFNVAECCAKQGEFSTAIELYQCVLAYATRYFFEVEKKPEYLKKCSMKC